MLKEYIPSYRRYRTACDSFGCKCVSIKEYTDLIKDASLKLADKETSKESCPYIVYELEGIYVKIKKTNEESLEINFFEEDVYDDVISKYKEKGKE
jgi:hypothetical protein